MFSLSATIFVLLSLWLIPNAWSLWRNLQAARASGLPYVVCLVDPDSIPYLIIKVPLRPVLERLLPTSLFNRIKLTITGWEFRDKFEVHTRVGPTFILVSCAWNEVWCADPAMAQVILARRKDFVSLPMAIKIMKFLGHNILTADGEDWARQRRIVAPNLNERISQGVWDESMIQSNQMVDYMLSQPNCESSKTSESLRAIAINVLGQVGYGQPKPFTPLKLPKDPTASMTYVEAISICVNILIVASLIPGKLLRLSFMPKVIQTVGAALKNLPDLTENMLEQERLRAKLNPEAGNNLMSMLVRLSDQGKSQDAGKTTNNAQYLTEEEISGNLFIFTGAGFDTTANTMTYAIALLASHPEWQQWIQEEIDVVLGTIKGGEKPDYETVFPQLVRCLALMLETLRLFPPITHLSRSTKTPQAVIAGGKSYQIPAPGPFYVNVVALHTYPAVWGEDSTKFRPSRWIKQDSVSGNVETIITPPRGSFLPWSGGPRICPGQKMAQVEFVTVFSTLFRRCKIELVPKEGETLEQAKVRVRELMEDSQPELTLQMNNPEQLNFRWIKR